MVCSTLLSSALFLLWHPALSPPPACCPQIGAPQPPSIMLCPPLQTRSSWYIMIFSPLPCCLLLCFLSSMTSLLKDHLPWLSFSFHAGCALTWLSPSPTSASALLETSSPSASHPTSPSHACQAARFQAFLDISIWTSPLVPPCCHLCPQHAILNPSLVPVCPRPFRSTILDGVASLSSSLNFHHLTMIH